MGLLNKIKNLLSDCTEFSSDNNKLTTQTGVLKSDLFIHPDLVNLVWIGDGEYQNYKNQPQETMTYPYEGFTIKVSTFGPNEPSLLYLKFPIEQPGPSELIERPPYYPYYSELTPKQKWLYWKFLSDPYNSTNDIGYVFIFYYGLERHLLYGNFDEAFDIILKLRDVYDNRSFQNYSASALILSAMIHKRSDCAEKFMDSLDKDYEFQMPGELYFLCKLELDIPITAYDIIKFHKFFGFSNNRYIKNNADLFIKNLIQNIINANCGNDLIDAKRYFSKSDFLNIETVSIPVFANVSIREKEVSVPNITTASQFMGSMLSLLSKTHEDTKYELASMRKKSKTPLKKKTPKEKTYNPPVFKPELLPYDITKPIHDVNNIHQFFKDIDQLNTYIEKARTLAKIRTQFYIKPEDINFDDIDGAATHWEITPYTKTGRLSKYPLTIYYRTYNYKKFDSKENLFGSMSYLKNGTIGKAELVNWINGRMYLIKLGIIKNSLSVKSVETTNKESNRIFIYKLK